MRKLSAGRKQREEGGDRRVISLPVTPTEGDYLNINTNQYLIFLSESKTLALIAIRYDLSLALKGGRIKSNLIPTANTFTRNRTEALDLVVPG